MGKKPISRDIALILVTAACAALGGLLGTWLEGREQVELQKRSLAIELQCKTAELFNEQEYVADRLVRKYGLSRVEKGDIPEQDIDALNRVTKQLNMQLARMFVSMSDHDYQIVAGGIPVGRDTIAKCRTRMLCQMRRAQWPGTKCATPENVRFYYYLERHK